MYKLIIGLYFLCLIPSVKTVAQTLFVDPAKGRDNASGSINDPLLSIGEAVNRANDFTGNEPVTIKLAPGLYILTDQVVLKHFKAKEDTTRYTIEAAIMPDDTGWLPSKMPVIQSVSPNNKNWAKFDHCTGFQVERNNTCFKGLKFVGNSNPAVVYYYTIERHFPELKGMEVSQCIFVGNRNSAPIQGALFAQGSGIKVDHCIFYECKNALLLFLSVNGFSLTNSIIYGAYEGAIWFGKFSDFVFRDNVIANNNCFWISMKDYTPRYTFTNSLITDNKIFMGLNNDGVIESDEKTVPITKDVQRSGKVMLNVVDTDTIPMSYLNLSPASAGRNIPAGLFRSAGSR
ncbi:right-handed parallel beta-helix repeat-containing protein [Chitinophaga ginsengisegetis]|uniref:right-handed parallel beta-helix repeat-containing protein n=1 Tax=Chitinophaga ginsengisegetis TaxID=393003 RepID=UPI000DB9DACD|nr:right-handed parallel beta-helix repeat-containing protein [Chitinophaga ginsengisegetis]MDR6568802.1 hypothetical protein [Chitinophaga ginsengisegetis]MDR6647967.1 hypothetical protein [Chitinophaga ginsengisegetis]MDR6654883.1 hypothetical protein [Chitinophaga ginsengisegetis]